MFSVIKKDSRSMDSLGIAKKLKWVLYDNGDGKSKPILN